jgi:hypothetical protein
LTEFLSGISERGSSVSLPRDRSASAVIATERKKASTAAAEATAKIQSGETDRMPAKAVPSASSGEATAKAQPKKRAASNLPHVLVPLSALLMLGLLVGSIAMILQFTSPPPESPKANGKPRDAAVAPAEAPPAGRAAQTSENNIKVNEPQVASDPTPSTGKAKPAATMSPEEKDKPASAPAKRKPKKKPT